MNKKAQLQELPSGIIALVIAIILLVIGIVFIQKLNDAVPEQKLNNVEQILISNGTSSNLAFQPVSEINFTAKNYFLSFDGRTELVNITDSNNLDAYGNFSVSMWIRLNHDVSSFASSNAIIDKLSGGQGGYEIRFNNSTKKINFLVENFTYGTLTAIETTSIMNRTWTHYAFVWINETKNASIYKDGFASGSTQTPAFAQSVGSNSQSLNIGAGSVSSNFANVSLDNILFFKRALNISEIEKFNQSRLTLDNFNQSDLVYWLPFNENSGDRVFDIQDSNHGSNIGATPYIDDTNSSIRLLQNSLDYSISSKTFTLINESYSRGLINGSYTYSVPTTVNRDINQSLTGVGDFSDFIPLIVISLAATVIIGLILTGFARQQR